ncbi:MAG: HscaRG, partial [Polaromonas sp.]|nr:HscaRG [Polaromonas sp.]
GVDGVFCNTDFWSTASAWREYEQGLRALAAAKAAGVQHFIWSSLDNAVSLTDGSIAVPHFDSKAAVESWIGLMRTEEFMKKDVDGWFSRHVSVLVTAPYFENLQFRAGPKAGKLSDGRDGFVFNLPLAGAAYPLIALQDIAWFAKHLLDHPAQWGGRTLRVVGEALTGHQIAATFESETGIPAEYRNLPLETIRAALPDTGHDVAAMGAFFQNYDLAGRSRDLPALRKLHPGLLTFRAWLAGNGWRGEPVEVQKKAVRITQQTPA